MRSVGHASEEMTGADVVGPLAEIVAGCVGRALALVDLNEMSATHGCGDRGYWHYRTLTNFPGATWQQTMLGLAALYRTSHVSNPHHRDPVLLDAIAAMLRFWATQCQHGDGAFDEWYLNEHSYCATAITSAGAGLTLYLIGDLLPADARKTATEALTRASAWLSLRYNPEVMNQNLAAATALQALGVLTDETRWQDAAREKLLRVAADQNPEGWLPEYAGADFGYSTLALDQLAATWTIGPHNDAGLSARSIAGRLIAFLARVQGGGSTMPGPLGSRGTSHLFPYGALAFSDGDPEARSLAARWLGAVALGVARTPVNVDDRYFSYFYFPQFALALWQASRSALLPSSADVAPGVEDLHESGFVVIRQPEWSAMVSRRLGGAVAVTEGNEGAAFHLGYEVCTADGRRFSSATWISGQVETTGSLAAGDELVVESGFRAVTSGVPLRKLDIPFQMVTHLLRNSQLAEAFQALVKRRMISPSRTLPLRLRRRISVSEKGIQLIDELIPCEGLHRLSSLDVAHGISMHSPSAKMGRLPPLEGMNVNLKETLACLNDGRTATVSMRIAADRSRSSKARSPES